MSKTSPRQVMWLKWNAQHPSRALYMPFLNCNSHTHVVTIYKLTLGKVRISSHLAIWNSSYFSHGQLHQSVHFLMLIVYLWPTFKLSAPFPFPLVAAWCAVKPKLLLGGRSSNPGSVWPILDAACDKSNVCAATQIKVQSKGGVCNTRSGQGSNLMLGEHQGQHKRGREAYKPLFLTPFAWQAPNSLPGDNALSVSRPLEGTGNDSEQAINSTSHCVQSRL